MTANGQPPVQPRPTLRVGVTGHIRLERAERSALVASVRGVLQAVRDAAYGVAGGAGGRQLVLVSPLAAGADQLVADEARSLGYELEVPLPFLREQVEQDFEADEASRARFGRLLGEARQVLELGSQRRERGSDANDQAYETVGWVVLSQSDLLLTIWDGKPSQGRGGTGDVVAMALASGMAVVQVPLEAPHVPRLCVGGAESAACTLGAGELESMVRRLLDPFVVVPPPAGQGSARPDPSLAQQGRAYADFLAEPLPRERPWLQRAAARGLQGLWRGLLRVVGGPRSGASGPVEVDRGLRVAALADHYQGLYRGAFVALYVLGALAVTFALAGAAAALAHDPHHLALVFTCGELASLLLIATTYACARRGRWHRKGTNYRVLAELLRHQAALAPLGLAVPAPRPRAHLDGEADLTLTWMVVYQRGLAAEQGLAAARFDAPRLLAVQRELAEEWLGGQVRYHTRVAAGYHRAAHRLEAVAFWLFALALLPCLLHFVLPHQMGGWLSLLAAWLPALGAAVHGILGNADFLRLEGRSHAMAERLAESQHALRALAGADLSWRRLALLAREACSDMLTELDDWQALARHRDVRLP